MDARYPFTKRRKNDSAISPVVGTILMVGVTVALAATVLTVMNAFGNSTPSETSDAVFKVQGIDSDGNSATDSIKLTYISGSVLSSGALTVQIAMADGTTMSTPNAAWSPGDFRIYDVAVTTPPTSSAGTWFVTVSHLGSTVVDSQVKLDE